MAIPEQWPGDFISSCQTSAVLFGVIHAGGGWRLKLIGGATGKSTNSFQEITTFNILGSVGSFCKLYKSVVGGISTKLILKSEVRWIQQILFYCEIISSGLCSPNLLPLDLFFGTNV